MTFRLFSFDDPFNVCCEPLSVAYEGAVVKHQISGLRNLL